MSDKIKSVKPTVTSPDAQGQVRFNEDSCSDKVSETGFNYFYDGGKGLLGALNAAKKVAKFRPIYIFNTDAVYHYVAFGTTSGMAAPAGGATGIPIPPNQGVVVSSGSNTYIRSDNALVFGYMANDNVVEIEENTGG